MRKLQTKGGFSLVELLTVIAIIAILAAIIFPVMNSVRREAKKTQCIANLHSIAIGLQMYQQDNRKYPETIGGYVTMDASGNVVPMERTTGDTSLYPEYIKTVKGLHCSLSQTTKTDAIIHVAAGGGATFDYYAYDSYDVFYPGLVNTGAPVTVGASAVRYAVLWAANQAAVGNLAAYPPGTTSTPELEKYDYARQLKFKKPSTDTLVTWCSYHRDASAKSMVPVLFLDGHCDNIPAGDIEGADGAGGSRWRVQPKK